MWKLRQYKRIEHSVFSCRFCARSGALIAWRTQGATVILRSWKAASRQLLIEVSDRVACCAIVSGSASAAKCVFAVHIDAISSKVMSKSSENRQFLAEFREISMQLVCKLRQYKRIEHSVFSSRFCAKLSVLSDWRTPHSTVILRS